LHRKECISVTLSYTVCVTSKLK